VEEDPLVPQTLVQIAGAAALLLKAIEHHSQYLHAREEVPPLCK
jgi:hypothetical protein